MTVKLKLVNNNIEVFETANFVTGPVKEMAPDILDVKIYSGKKLLVHKTRLFKFWYKHITYNTPEVQEKVKKIRESQDKQIN